LLRGTLFLKIDSTPQANDYEWQFTKKITPERFNFEKIKPLWACANTL